MLNRLRSAGRLAVQNPLLYRSPLYQFAQMAQLAKNSQEFLEKTRNIAIIAHVDHGKTTLVDSMLRFGGINLKQECALDSNELQRQKGITILSKCTSIFYNSYNINIVDTPGHHDFGGQVQRILGMVDGVCLVVCATEGPMTQSKYVLRKALERNLKPIVIINKVDRSTARPSEVANDIFSLFCDLNCPDDLLEYPLYFASGKNSWAVENLSQEKKNIQCVLKGIVENIPEPKIDKNEKFSMSVTQTHPDTYFGRNMLGRVNSGQVYVGQNISLYDQSSNLVESGKITRISKKNGLSVLDLEKAFPGDIVSIAGLPKCKVTHTAVEEGYPEKILPSIKIDPPLMGVSISINSSPLAGKDGVKVNFNDLKTRLKEEADIDVALEVTPNDKQSFITVLGRGDLHIGILLQKMRRQGYEFSVTPPEIMFRTDPKTNEKLEPFEKIIFEVQEKYQGLIMEKMNHRKGVYLSSTNIAEEKISMEFICSTRGLLGIRSELLNETQGSTLIRSQFHEYKPYMGIIVKNPKGALVSMLEGVTTSYCLKDLEKFGTLFVKPNQKVYSGMVIGEHNKDHDVELNPTKQKKLTNIRTHAHDEKIILVPPKIMTIEESICYLRPDELLQVTPKDIRIRKKYLTQNQRDRARRNFKNELKNQ